jgi:hypothetical protein
LPFKKNIIKNFHPPINTTPSKILKKKISKNLRGYIPFQNRKKGDIKYPWEAKTKKPPQKMWR